MIRHGHRSDWHLQPKTRTDTAQTGTDLPIPSLGAAAHAKDVLLFLERLNLVQAPVCIAYQMGAAVAGRGIHFLAGEPPGA